MQRKNHLPFIYCLIIYFVAGLILFVVTKHGEVELYINRHHQFNLDFFFKYWTYIGDGWFIAVLIVLLLLYEFYAALLCVVAILIQTIIVHYLKNFVFHLEPRPKTFFKETSLYFVDGVEVYLINSFPSGHTAQAFCMSVILCLLIAKMETKYNNFWQIGLFLIAMLVGLSRMYLMQHFLRDTLAGACIGCLSAYLAYLLFEKLKISNSKVMQKSLLNLKN